MDQFERIKLQKIIGKNIRHIRELHKYTIEEFAEILDISPSFLGLVERGDRKFSLDNLLNLMEVFDLKFDELIDEEYTKTKKEIDFQ